MGDVDGDGIEDIIVGTYDPAHNPSTGSLYVFSLEGVAKAIVPVPGGLKHIPAIADVDADGRNDVIYRGLDGRIYIQNFGGGSPANVSWATHRGNVQRDGNYSRTLFPAGTPIVSSKSGGYKKAGMTWRIPSGNTPISIKIFRANRAEGPFSEIANLGGSARSFTDYSVSLGRQYIYEVRAQYSSGTVSSAPIPIFVWLNNNLIANGGFEEDDDSHWDKWFTGDIPWTDMTGSTVAPHSGDQSMEIRLQNKGNNSSITQQPAATANTTNRP
jgi:hypothetical protein